jgi:hypothetical protein
MLPFLRPNCVWPGVTCGASDELEAAPPPRARFTGNRPQGEIPPWLLGLHRLSLASNRLGGAIPDELETSSSAASPTSRIPGRSNGAGLPKTGARQRRGDRGGALTPECRRPGAGQWLGDRGGAASPETRAGQRRRRLGRGSGAGYRGATAAPKTVAWQWRRRPGRRPGDGGRRRRGGTARRQ